MAKNLVWIILMALCLAGCAATPTRESTGEYVDDAAITAKVKTAIFQDPSLKAMQIDVNTYRGTVQLSGFVDTEEAVKTAGEVAGKVDGVRNVQNRLSVKPRS